MTAIRFTTVDHKAETAKPHCNCHLFFILKKDSFSVIPVKIGKEQKYDKIILPVLVRSENYSASSTL